MKKIAVSLLLACALCLTGCVPIDSLNPLYSDNTVFDPALLGRWSGSEPNEILRVERGENNAYLIIWEKKENGVFNAGIFDAHLVNLGGEKYLDLVPTAMKWPSAASLFHVDTAKKGARLAPSLQRVAPGLYMEIAGPTPGKGATHEVQVKLHGAHCFFKTEIHEKSISLIYLDDVWVEKAIKKRLIQASHFNAANEEGSKNWVLTGSTAELQQLVVRAAADPDAFGAGLAFQKVQ